jgi:hypothetical protein
MDVVVCKSDMQFLLLLQNLIVIVANDCDLFVGVVVHTKMLQTSYYSFEMLLPSLLSCARML